MNSNNKKRLILVGVRQDDGEVKHVRGYVNPTWAIKYGKNAGEFAMFTEVDVTWGTTPPAPRVKAVANSTETV